MDSLDWSGQSFSGDGGGTAVNMICRRENGRVRRKRGKSGGVYRPTSTRKRLIVKRRENARKGGQSNEAIFTKVQLYPCRFSQFERISIYTLNYSC